MLIEYYQHPELNFDSVLANINFKPASKKEITEKIPPLKEKFVQIKISKAKEAESRWVMGQVRQIAIGNMDLAELNSEVHDKKVLTANQKEK
jgi:glutamyl-tRNA(Gln) amidotransferase subunit E